MKRTTTQYPEQVRLPTTSPTDVATFIQACIRDNMKEVQWQETRVHPQLVKLFNIPGFVGEYAQPRHRRCEWKHSGNGGLEDVL